jgi:S-layer protein
MTGGLTVTAAAVTGGATVTGGSGKDVLTASSGTAADKLNGGDGNDTLTSNTGANTLTGGTGSDKFVVTAASAAKTIYTTITDFGAGDSLQLVNTSGTESFVSTAVSLAALTSTASLTDAINTAVLGATTGQIKWFQFGGDTYVAVAAADHDATTGIFVDGSDQVVKLTGLVDLSGVGFNAGAQLLQA